MDAADWPLVGRDATCRAIVSALGDEPVRSVVIAGPTGVGRTRLAREAVAVATRDGRSARWAAGTGPASLVPLGALAHLIPAVDAASDPLVLLQRATAAIVGDASGPPPVLAVDDVHLLDQLSITLLHQLAASGAVPMILTVRTGGGAKDPVAPLWKDGRATRFDLQPLGRADTEQLVTQVLGDELETRTAERLWQLTQGNPLFLHEVLEDGWTSGRLRRARGLWRWEGPMNPSQRLVDIVLSHIGDLDDTEWRVLEALATAEPLSVHRLVGLSTREAVLSLERRGVISDQAAGEPGELRAAHPVYTAVVRTRVSGATLRLVRAQLPDVDDDPEPAPEQLLQRCVAMLDHDVPMRDAGLLADGAQCALSALDVALAERLARAAVEAGGGPAAYLALVEATRWSGHPEDSERLAVEAGRLAVTDVDTARLAAARALNLACALGRPQDAVAVLREAGARVRSTEGSRLLSAAESLLAALRGERRAARMAADALSAAPLGHPARPLAAAAAALALVMAGQTERALAAAQAGWTALESTSSASEAIHTRFVLAQAESLALYLAGRLDELDRRAEGWLRENLAVPEWAGDAIAAMHRGWAALAPGRLGQAVRWLEEALSGLERHDPAGMHGFCSTLLATACALGGDVGRARAVLEDRSRHRHGLLPIFEPLHGLARACLAGAEGRTAEAGPLLLEAATWAAERGQPAVEALLVHRAVRFRGGADAADRLRELAARLDSPLVGDLAAHAEAVVAEDGRRLEEVSRRLEQAGTLMIAAEAAAAAAAAHERAGSRRAAAEWTTKAKALAQECGVAEPRGGGLPSVEMTSREAEVARLACQGLSNQDIADRLYLSVRTVETHLSHVYTKLGITGRSGLAAFFPASGAATASSRQLAVDGAPAGAGHRSPR